ncbi:MAG: FtsX-like permease family protein [Candidatus Acidiferrales bacterium]
MLSQKYLVVPAASDLSSIGKRYDNWLIGLLLLAGLLAALASVNVASIVLVRTLPRRRELSIRSALGAGLFRVFILLASETVLIAGLAAIFSFVGGTWASRFVASQMSSDVRPFQLSLPFSWVLAVDTLAAGIFLGIVFGAVPLFTSLRRDLNGSGLTESLQKSAKLTGRVGARLLVAAQLALLTALVLDALVLTRSLVVLSHTKLGYDTRNVLLVELGPRPGGYGHTDLIPYYHDLLNRVKALPRVSDASAMLQSPLAPAYRSDEISTASGSSGHFTASINCVFPGLFSTLEIPIVKGQDFSDNPNINGAPAVISSGLSTRLFPHADPIGQTIAFGVQKSNYTVIGVAGNAELRSPSENRNGTNYVYLSCDRNPLALMSLVLVVRAKQSPLSIGPDIRTVVLDRGVQIPGRIRTLLSQVEQNLLEQRLLADLCLFFAAVAILVSASGIYGLSAYISKRRKNEIGIRMALGAEPRDVVWLLMREHAVSLVIGIALGLPAGIWLLHILQAHMYGIQGTRTWSCVAAAVLCIVVSASAVLLTTLEAVGTKPAETLRYEN